jgi:hypothetical protein
MRWAQISASGLNRRRGIRLCVIFAACCAAAAWNARVLAQATLGPPTFDAYPTTDPFVTATPYAGQPMLGQPYQPYCDTGGFEFGFHGAILEPQIASISSPIPVVGLFLDTISPDYDFEFSPRVWAGYQFPGGLGFRGRWWHFEGDGSGTPASGDLTSAPLIGLIAGGLGFSTNYDTLTVTNFTFSSEIELDAIDLEVSQEGQFHNWEFEVAGGVRYARIDFINQAGFDVSLTDTIPPGDPPSPPLGPLPIAFSAISEFEGVGPTINFFARRPLGFWEGLSFVADARFGFLFGDTDVAVNATFDDPPVTFGPIPIATVSSQAVQVWELRVGADWTRTLANGSQLHLGAFLEGQIWEWNSAIAPGSDLGFFGPTFFVEITH